MAAASPDLLPRAITSARYPRGVQVSGGCGIDRDDFHITRLQNDSMPLDIEQRMLAAIDAALALDESGPGLCCCFDDHWPLTVVRCRQVQDLPACICRMPSDFAPRNSIRFWLGL